MKFITPWGRASKIGAFQQNTETEGSSICILCEENEIAFHAGRDAPFFVMDRHTTYCEARGGGPRLRKAYSRIRELSRLLGVPDNLPPPINDDFKGKIRSIVSIANRLMDGLVYLERDDDGKKVFISEFGGRRWKVIIYLWGDEETCELKMAA